MERYCLMKKSVVLKLRKKTIGSVDEWGNPVDYFDEWEIFAERKSVRQSEYYQAAAQGLKPSVVFEMYTEEFKGAESIVNEGIEYSIIRTYQKTLDRLEVICERKIADGH